MDLHGESGRTRTPGQVCRIVQDKITELGGEYFFSGVEDRGGTGRDRYLYQFSDGNFTDGAAAVIHIRTKLEELKKEKGTE